VVYPAKNDYQRTKTLKSVDLTIRLRQANHCPSTVWQKDAQNCQQRIERNHPDVQLRFQRILWYRRAAQVELLSRELATGDWRRQRMGLSV